MTWMPGAYARQWKLEEPYEDVPAHLRGPLLYWVRQQVLSPDALVAICIAMRLRVPDPRMASNQNSVLETFMQRCDDDEFLLTVIEVVLTHTAGGRAHALQETLDYGNSIYTVRGDRRGLEVRVLPEVKAQVEAAMRAAGETPAGHLAAAWSAAYARVPSPKAAYSECVFAVEAAAAPIASPADSKATLGKMIPALRDKPEKWRFALRSDRVDGVLHIADMMRLLLESQIRHGSATSLEGESPEEARAAVHVAATLVQFCASGAFARAVD